MNVVIEAQGLDFAIKQIEEMAARGVKTRPLMGKIGQIMLQSTARNFEEEGRPKWKPWARSTVLSYMSQAIQKARNTKAYGKAGERGRERMEQRRIDKDVSGGKILQRSGDLRKSVSLGDVTDLSVEIGSSLRYARIHQLGGTIKGMTIVAKNKKALLIPTAGGLIFRKKATIPERKIPARPYFKLQNEDETFILRAVEDYMLGGVS